MSAPVTERPTRSKLDEAKTSAGLVMVAVFLGTDWFDSWLRGLAWFYVAVTGVLCALQLANAYYDWRIRRDAS